MNKDEFEGNWHQLKGKVREKRGKLTNDDIEKSAGKYEQFLGKIQAKYGFSKEQAEKELRDWKCEHDHKEKHRKIG